MKKLYSILILIMLVSSTKAQVSKTVNVSVAGTLSSILSASQKQTITNLKLTGTINAKDFAEIQFYLIVLQELDLSSVSIAAYQGPGGPVGATKTDIYPVNEIPMSAFHDYTEQKNNKILKSIILPTNLISIGDLAFKDCDSLKNVIIPTAVTKIGSESFRNCESISSIIFSNTVTSIGSNCFDGCSNLSYVSIGTGLSNISNYVFNNCVKLKSIIIPSNIKSIDNYAFNSCGFNSISIPISITNIGSYAFGNNPCIKELIIPSSVSKIGDYAFSNCDSLKVVSFYNSVTGSYGFYDCDRINKINFYSNSTTINDYSFYSCDSIIDIDVNDKVISIGNYSFKNCSKVKNVSIGNNVKTIGSSAFENCSNLQNLIIGSGITTIGGSAFNGCITIKTIHSKMNIPIEASAYSYFFSTNLQFWNCNLYVPIGTKTLYQNAKEWENFANIFEELTAISTVDVLNINIKVDRSKNNIIINELPDNNMDLDMFSSTGKLILKKIISNNNQISIDEIPNGIYIIYIHNKDNHATAKIII